MFGGSNPPSALLQFIGDIMDLFGKYLQGLSVFLSSDIVSSCFLAVMVMAVIVAVFSLMRG